MYPYSILIFLKELSLTQQSIPSILALVDYGED